MNKKIAKILFFSLLALYTIYFCASTKNTHEYKILDVIGADRFYIDINKNGKIDENEFVKLKYVKAFSPFKTSYSEKTAQRLGISQEEYLKLGVLANNWAKNELANKTIEIYGLEKCSLNQDSCYIQAYYNNQDLAKLLLANGLAYIREDSKKAKYFSNYNFYQIKNNLASVQKIDFIIINLKNGITHKLNCDFANKINFAKLDINKKNSHNRFCKICSNFNKNIKEFKQSKKKYPKSINKSFKYVDIYLINPLENKKPNTTCKNEFCKRLIKEINASRNSIDIALYGFGEQKEILDALKNAKERGVKIRSVIDSSKNPSPYLKTETFSKEFNSIYDSQESLMHNKFFIFDNKIVMSGSTNISAAGSGGYNSNISFFINNEKITQKYAQEFEQMHNGNFSKSKHKNLQNEDETINAYFSPKDNILKNVIIPLIKKSKKNVYISAFYLTDSDFISELIKAKNRNIEILIIIDALGAKNFRNKINLLRDSGISVIVENWGGKNHEKTIVIDNEILLSGSCNFSKSGFYKNDENVVAFKDKEIAQFYSDYFLYLFNSINKKFLYIYPSAESKDSINSCYDGIDNDYDGKIDLEDTTCR